MYKALKAAQNDIQTALLKFTDDVVELQSSNGDSSAMANAVQLLHAKQDVQFRVLNGAIENLNENMSKIVTLLSDRNTNAVVRTDSTIPSVQPRATTAEMKDVVSSMPAPVKTVSSPAIHAAPVPLVVAAVPVDDSLSEIEVDDDEEQEVDVEEVEEEEVEEEEDLEVEEWTYKGRTFFKDTNNTVYANDSGEVGDAIGTYDPVKNILKKL